MDAALFAKLLSDKDGLDLKKLRYKYPRADIGEFVSLLQSSGFYESLPLPDAAGQPLVYLPGTARVRLSAAKTLLTPQSAGQSFGLQAMEDEIISTFGIEQIDTSRDSVRKILSGCAPDNDSEARIYGMKRGLEFISDPAHTITEENLHTLYQTVIGNYLPPEDQLLPDRFYRHDAVYIVSDKVEHTGLAWQKLPELMAALVSFANQSSEINDLLKAAMLHFYVAWLHPYFDGNGRMARLVHLWYLVQQGYSSALFLPMSRYIEKTRGQYYAAYSLVERNVAISGVLDVTPFLVYCIEQVYHKLDGALPATDVMGLYTEALAQGRVTEKERQLWQFVLSAYGDGEFSTKQLERDFGGAAYATIRAFVLKFTDLGLLTATRYGSRSKYRVA